MRTEWKLRQAQEPEAGGSGCVVGWDCQAGTAVTPHVTGRGVEALKQANGQVDDDKERRYENDQEQEIQNRCPTSSHCYRSICHQPLNELRYRHCQMSCRLRLSKGQCRQFGKWDLFDFTVSNVPNPPSNHLRPSARVGVHSTHSGAAALS